MNILVQLSHPAHFHLYKNAIKNWQETGNKVFILIKTKDILEDLLKSANLLYYNILPDDKRKSKFDIFRQIIVKDWRILKFCIKHKIDLLTGSTPEVAHVSWLLRKSSVNTGEDDAAVVPMFSKIAGKFVKTLLTPEVCNNGTMEKKSVKYNSYHELAYLHPNHFSPDKNVVEKYFSAEKPYFILRFAKLNAHHDKGIQGINTEIAQKLIDILKPHGDIYITSERELEPQFEQYRIKINPLDMHDVMAFAQIYIGDSQTMAAEAGVLGVPFVRFNDFVGRIGYLDELENHYHLGFGIKTNEVERLYSTVNELVTMQNRKKVFAARRAKMLSEKIDYAKFLTWFIENYPQSKKIMLQNADYQYNFK
ncbi:MAG: DUF354 domain-containing protein [Prevotellaceae bacterium]|jgi:predicted glycosyltransferase|nr:DUF354 domain-containing protein [Prevotellaceae bacterium]